MRPPVLSIIGFFLWLAQDVFTSRRRGWRRRRGCCYGFLRGGGVAVKQRSVEVEFEADAQFIVVAAMPNAVVGEGAAEDFEVLEGSRGAGADVAGLAAEAGDGFNGAVGYGEEFSGGPDAEDDEDGEEPKE